MNLTGHAGGHTQFLSLAYLLSVGFKSCFGTFTIEFVPIFLMTLISKFSRKGTDTKGKYPSNQREICL